MVQRPVRRVYSEAPPKGAGNVDLPRQARFLQAFGWLAMAGLFWGGLIGALMGGIAGALLGGLGGLLVLGVGGGGILFLITDRVGGMARVLYDPTGSSIPRRKEYSYAESLAARGAFEEAVEVYEEALAEDPSDPVPYMAAARILRDELGRFDEAARWFRRARREAEIDRAREVLVAKELVELYRNKLDQPRKAAPELARIAERFAGTPEGEWAGRELRDLKQSMLEKRDNEWEAHVSGSREEAP